MNFFELELQQLFKDETIIKHLSFSGATCWGWLNDDLRVKVQFTCADMGRYQYDALKITVSDIMDDPIGAELLKFQDVWGLQPSSEDPNSPDGVVPHIWDGQRKTRWYGWRPSPADRELLRQQIRQHLEPFRERTPERRRNGPKLVYICAPLRGNVIENIEFARQKAQKVFQAGDIPVCPHIILPSKDDPDGSIQAEAAREIGLRLVESCRQINVYGSAITEGMQEEISRALERDIPVSYDPELIRRMHPRKKPVRKGNRDR
ncbi:DUF7768 domain-containing protein [Oscillibacter sp.]|uniref:DUF7768 domain-containing protein n=1 Tax=Oscillibacter sp. TaxID=1945593 RepID=UPI002D7FE6A7|nr:DUF4406 domain-containing protein [Oscillibacter sp.]